MLLWRIKRYSYTMMPLLLDIETSPCVLSQLRLVQQNCTQQGLNNRHLFSQFWRLEVWDHGVGMVRFWWEPLLACRWSLSCCVLPCQREVERQRWAEWRETTSSLASFLLRMLIPSQKPLNLMTSSKPNYLLKDQSAHTITLELVFCHMNFEENTNIQSITLYE